MTPELAKQICINAHKGQWRKPATIKTDSWDCYKQQVEFIHENGNKIVWCNADTFLVYEPYSNHPIAVADMLSTDEEKILAYLHDVIEDCPDWHLLKEPDYSKFYLVNKNKESILLTFRIYWALHLLSHPKNMPYIDYIKQLTSANMISGLRNTEINKLATKVKLADMFHNMSTSTSEKQKAKYLKYMPVLLNNL